VHPETSISKQQTHQSGEPIWHAFTQFVKKTSVPDSAADLLTYLGLQVYSNAKTCLSSLSSVRVSFCSAVSPSEAGC